MNTLRLWEVTKAMQIRIEPRKSGDRGGYICMPLKKNVPEGREGWKLVKCPECGLECWDRQGILSEAEKSLLAGAVSLCTECALRKGESVTITKHANVGKTEELLDFLGEVTR